MCGRANDFNRALQAGQDDTLTIRWVGGEINARLEDRGGGRWRGIVSVSGRRFEMRPAREAGTSNPDSPTRFQFLDQRHKARHKDWCCGFPPDGLRDGRHGPRWARAWARSPERDRKAGPKPAL